MTSVLIRNPSEDQPIQDTLKSDGSRYRFEMILDNARSRAYADTTEELVETLTSVPYVGLSTEEQTHVRVTYMSSLLAPIQATILSRVNVDDIPDDQKEILFQPRFKPVEVDLWDSEIPLVLLDVHYSPFSDLPQPLTRTIPETGVPNIFWLKADSDMDMLISLDSLGMISLSESTDYQV